MIPSPAVTIIIPTYNDCSVVCDAIDCALNQIYDNVETIVVDDGSSDGTELLLKEKYGSRIKYIYQENKGLSSARNTGLKYASGKYLQFLDADDLIDPNKISMQVGKLQYVSGISLAYCDYIRTDTEGMKIQEEGIRHVLRKEKPLDDLIMEWETALSIPPHCFLFDSAIFREYGISFDVGLANHEDWECWIRVFALNPKIVFIERPLANYRIRLGSLSTKRVKMRQGYLKAIKKQIQKNAPNKEIVKKLKIRKMQIEYLYRDASPSVRIMEGIYPIIKPIIKKLYTGIVPWGIRRIFRMVGTKIVPLGIQEIFGWKNRT